ncbi:endolytic transglycosylase MltG [Pseudonocardia xinjiangensis]|uniref:endolytic transglycosylase MltG n=1 Tax=Pseudonocardia xinjiangensis TaxID=75289 RepID=UPI003D8CD301
MNPDGWDQRGPHHHNGGADGSQVTGQVGVYPSRQEQLASRRAGQRSRTQKRRRRNLVVLLAALLLLGAVAGGGYYVFSSLFSTPDFEGSGTGDVIVQVHDGDSTTQIGGTLAQRGVVAGVQAFTEAAAQDDRIRSVQPGYYQMRSRMSGESAVELLLDPKARVGQLEIRGGVQLDDTRAPDGTVAPGVLTLISKATCFTQDGAQQCVSVDALRAAMTGTDPAALGVPAWALEEVAKAEPARRLEGLLMPGRYNVEPGTSAVDVLRGLLTTSDARLEASGLVAGAQSIGSNPYTVLTIASLVEKEAITPDMPKVARVIYNRLGAGQRLELDSMVNYPLDLQALRTTADDRARPGPYNSYVVAGLPPTPISAPGIDAIKAALTPAPGPWFFFVRCQTNGSSCFAATFAEHSANVAEARRNGAF